MAGRAGDEGAAAVKPAGRLIAVEGIDGAGKSGLVRCLAMRLEARGVEVVCTAEPTRDTPTGRAVRGALASGVRDPVRELALFTADRQAHVAETIRPALQCGAVVLVDRYYFSSAAYQAEAGGGPTAIVAMNERFAPRPDGVILLVVPPAVALARVDRRGGRSLFETAETLDRVQAAYVAALRGAAGVAVMDAQQDASVVAACAGAVVDRWMAQWMGERV
jgi:dTMP kinase